MAISFLVFMAGVIIYSLIDLYGAPDQVLSKRKKVNLTYLILIVPFVGSLIYFLIKRRLMVRKHYFLKA